MLSSLSSTMRTVLGCARTAAWLSIICPVEIDKLVTCGIRLLFPPYMAGTLPPLRKFPVFLYCGLSSDSVTNSLTGRNLAWDVILVVNRAGTEGARYCHTRK